MVFTPKGTETPLRHNWVCVSLQNPTAEMVLKYIIDRLPQETRSKLDSILAEDMTSFVIQNVLKFGDEMFDFQISKYENEIGFRKSNGQKWEQRQDEEAKTLWTRVVNLATEHHRM